MRSNNIHVLALLIAMISLATTFNVTGQKSGLELIDSLIAEVPKAAIDTQKVNLLTNISSTYKRIDPEKGVEYGELGVALAEQINWTKGRALTLSIVGINYFFMNAFEEAIPKLLQSLEFAEQCQLTPTIALACWIVVVI